MYIVDDICYAGTPGGEIDIAPEYMYENGIPYNETDNLQAAAFIKDFASRAHDSEVGKLDDDGIRDLIADRFA